MARITTRMNRLLTFSVVVAATLLLLTAIGCGGEDVLSYETPPPDATADSDLITPDLSSTALTGKQVFDANCSVCHGADVMGSATGPPLIDRIYEPGHHADFSIRNAVRNGVPQHHWWFGNMPPVAGITDQQVEQLICYIRELQLANGIFEEGTYSFTC